MTGDVFSFNLAETVVKWVDVGIFVLDKNFEVKLWNNFMAHHSGRAAEDIIGKNLFDSFPELPKPWFTKKINSVFLLNNFAFISWENRPYLFRFAHNRPITGGVDHMYQNCMLLPLKAEQGKPEAVCVMVFDATDTAIAQNLLKEALESISEISNRDGLTGVYNRRYLENTLNMEFERTRRYGGTFSLILFDLDFFKKVNDTYGHLGGDRVLMDVADRLKERVRASDIVGRYGGEEFMVILPETNLEGAVQFAEGIRQLVEWEPVIFEDKNIPVTISMGVTEFNGSMSTYSNMTHQADVALYASKAAGRNCVTAYSVDLEKLVAQAK